MAHADDDFNATATVCTTETAAIAHLDCIPGIGPALAEMLVAEVGTAMSRFPSAGHLAAWTGPAPGNNESAGKRRSGRTRKGNPYVKVGLVQATRAAVRSIDTYLAAQCRHLVRRLGDKRALVAHSLIVIVYQLLKRKEAYRDFGGDYFERHQPTAVVQRLTHQIEKLGYSVTVVAPATA